MARVQITFDPETHKRARQRASELGLPFAEYLRSLVRKDLGNARPKADVSCIFNLGSGGHFQYCQGKGQDDRRGV